MSINTSNVKAVIKTATDLMDVVEPFVQRFGPQAQAAVKEYGPQAAAAAKRAATTLGAGAVIAGGAAKRAGSMAAGVAAGAAGAVRDSAASAHEKREQERIVAEARHSTIAQSAYSASAAEFEAACTAAPASDLPVGGFMSLPGCYAILVLPKEHAKDLATFKEVYVGSAPELGAAVYDQLIGKGNPDIYADRKYGQALQVLLFPCDEADQDELKAALMLNLQAFASYNAREEARNAPS